MKSACPFFATEHPGFPEEPQFLSLESLGGVELDRELSDRIEAALDSGNESPCLALLGRLREHAPLGAEQSYRSGPYLIVDTATGSAICNGDQYDIPSPQACRYLKVLADHPGRWISGNELNRYDPELEGVRTDKLAGFFPVPIRSLIETKRGTGSRLRLA